MIYFLKHPDTDIVSIRYYRTARSYEKQNKEGFEILGVQKGSLDTKSDFETRFCRYRDLNGFHYHLIGELDRYLGWPNRERDIHVKEIAQLLSIKMDLARAAMKRLHLKKAARKDVPVIYEEFRRVEREREKLSPDRE